MELAQMAIQDIKEMDLADLEETLPRLQEEAVTAEEAASFLAKAQELVTKHGFTADEVARYYGHVSNGVLWPLFHYVLDRLPLRVEYWAEYEAANARFAEDIKVTFPLLSDFKRTTVRDYGVFSEEGGYGTRATFVVDKEGIIRHIEQGRSAIDPSGAYQACSIFVKKKS